MWLRTGRANHGTPRRSSIVFCDGVRAPQTWPPPQLTTPFYLAQFLPRAFIVEITGVVTGPVFDMCSSSDNLNCFAAMFSPGQFCRGGGGQGGRAGPCLGASSLWHEVVNTRTTPTLVSISGIYVFPNDLYLS